MLGLESTISQSPLGSQHTQAQSNSPSQTLFFFTKRSKQHPFPIMKKLFITVLAIALASAAPTSTSMLSRNGPLLSRQSLGDELAKLPY